jgi:transposase InsO family protein
MTTRKRALLEPTDDWQQLQFQLDWPEQNRYELIRPVVVFGRSPVERSQQTGLSARTIYRKVERFDQLGMQSLFEVEEDADSKRRLPQPIRRAIVQLKAEYPPFRPNELATICYVRFNRRPSSHTVKKILAEEPPPAEVSRRFPPYAEIGDALERRGAIVRLHAEGWNIASIAGYLETTRRRVYETLSRWVEEGIRGLEDKSHARHQLVVKADLRAMEAVRKLQQNPELGEFRIRSALKQMGINLSARTCGRILARNRKLYGLRGPEAKPHSEPKEMPFKAAYRHQYWTVDIRYIDVHQLGGGNVYSITILENYSRFIVGSILSRTQDQSAYLRVLLTALTRHGAPGTIVSDGGSVFKATHAKAIYAALGITHQRIDPGQPWQSYIETNFNVQRRMADYHFGQAESWAELEIAHAMWLHDYNAQEHLAHQKRQDGRRSPEAVLGWVLGKRIAEEELVRLFTMRVGRRLDRQGYVRFRNWRIYGERGVAGQRAMLWLSEEYLSIEFQNAVVAQYTVKYRSDHQRLRAVIPTRLFETDHRSPQLPLLEDDAGDWRLSIELPQRRRRRRPRGALIQMSLFSPDAYLQGSSQ